MLVFERQRNFRETIFGNNLWSKKLVVDGRHNTSEIENFPSEKSKFLQPFHLILYSSPLQLVKVAEYERGDGSLQTVPGAGGAGQQQEERDGGQQQRDDGETHHAEETTPALPAAAALASQVWLQW